MTAPTAPPATRRPPPTVPHRTSPPGTSPHRALLAGTRLVGVWVAGMLLAACTPAPPRPDPATLQSSNTDYATWWQHQREKEQAERYREAPRQQRQAVTGEHYELWNAQRSRRLRLPEGPF